MWCNHNCLNWVADFECRLDEQQKPIDVSQWSQVDETGNCQKLVVTVTGSILAAFLMHIKYCVYFYFFTFTGGGCEVLQISMSIYQQAYLKADVQILPNFWCTILCDQMPSVLWNCWLGGRKGIRPVKNWVVGCWRGYLSGAMCRFAYGLAVATATHCLLLQ